MCAPHAPFIPAAGSDSHTVDQLFFNDPAHRAYKLFTKLCTLGLHKTSCMVLIHLDAIVISIVDLYKPFKQTDAKHGTSETYLIVIENEPGRICDGDSRKKTCLKGGRIP